jgi:hypothetical protein
MMALIRSRFDVPATLAAADEFVSPGGFSCCLSPLDDDEKLAAWVHEHPRVLERPIVVNEDTKRAVIGRPPENVLGILTP